jgi:hypothetical protein
MYGAQSGARQNVPYNGACLARWKVAFSDICDCLKDNQAAAQHHSLWNTHGKYIDECCKKKKKFQAWKTHSSCGQRSIGIVGKIIGGCSYGACCSNFMSFTKPYTLEWGNVEVDQYHCYIMIVAASKLFQCCTMFAGIGSLSFLSGSDAASIATFVGDICCQCASITIGPPSTSQGSDDSTWEE